MSFSPDIRILSGFSGLNFGQSVTEAKELFGAPEEEEELNDEILNASSCVFHYWENGFSLFFDNFNNKVFNSVEVDNPETVLFGKKIFSLKEKELIELLAQNGYKLTDSENHDWGEKRISFDEANLDFYFQNGKLVSVNFGAPEINNNIYFSPN